MELELKGTKRKTMSTIGTMTKVGDSRQTDPEKEPDVVVAGELAVREADKKTEGLTDAKDKAQLTATTAMSIVHITLLKEVLDRGPQLPYYQVSLGLIITAIILQVIVGIIALLITNVRKYYDKYRDNPLDDFCENIFQCKCKGRERIRRENRIKNIVARKNLVDLSNWNMLPPEEGKREAMDLADFAEEEGAGCCNCVCTSEVHPAYEYDILDRYDVYCELMVRGEIAVVRPSQELQSLQRNITRAKTDIEIYESRLTKPDADKETIQGKLTGLKAKLGEYQENALDVEKNIQDEKVIQKQGRILYKYADAIRRNRVLKMISFWQHAINYILYCIFIINAFIAGFGMATTGPDGSPGELRESAGKAPPAPITNS